MLLRRRFGTRNFDGVNMDVWRLEVNSQIRDSPSDRLAKFVPRADGPIFASAVPFGLGGGMTKRALSPSAHEYSGAEDVLGLGSGIDSPTQEAGQFGAYPSSSSAMLAPVGLVSKADMPM